MARLLWARLNRTRDVFELCARPQTYSRQASHRAEHLVAPTTTRRHRLFADSLLCSTLEFNGWLQHFALGVLMATHLSSVTVWRRWDLCGWRAAGVSADPLGANQESVTELVAPQGVSLKRDHVSKIIGTQRDSAPDNDATSCNAARLAFTAITGRGRQVGATTVDLVHAVLTSPPACPRNARLLAEADSGRLASARRVKAP
jgi:hypothetical protein